MAESGSTLGGGTGGETSVGSLSTRFKMVANFRIAFFVVSPASSVIVVVDGGDVKIVIMSVAACRKKNI